MGTLVNTTLKKLHPVISRTYNARIAVLLCPWKISIIRNINLCDELPP
ncbi:MAG: hypothetical protein KKH20_02965 [Proteobacteria bacterium]|nr:hypothetical protein [Pseudomonadota bacterium]MBU4100323.1 hypothetical protein [Pseudomonadota bacterium]